MNSERKSCERVMDGIVMCGFQTEKLRVNFWMESWCVKIGRESCARILDGIAVCGLREFRKTKLCANSGWHRGVRISAGKAACEF